MTREPVAVVNGVTALVEASISFAVAFGLKWGPEQVGATMAVVVAVGNLTKTWWARSQVTPVDDPRSNDGRRLIAEGIP